jgi:hypothetical protein
MISHNLRHFRVFLAVAELRSLTLASERCRVSQPAVTQSLGKLERETGQALADLKARGLAVPPELAIGDGALGFWKALEEEFGATRQQRCWVHKTMNVLNKLPKSVQPKAKADLKDIWMAESRKDAEKAFDRFLAKYEAKYDKAATCLAKDREALLAFYDFPAEHWKHIRTGIRSRAPSQPSVIAPHVPRAASRTTPA